MYKGSWLLFPRHGVFSQDVILIKVLIMNYPFHNVLSGFVFEWRFFVYAFMNSTTES